MQVFTEERPQVAEQRRRADVLSHRRRREGKRGAACEGVGVPGELSVIRSACEASRAHSAAMYTDLSADGSKSMRVQMVHGAGWASID